MFIYSCVCVCVQAAFFTRSIYELIGVDFIFDLYTKPKHFAFPSGRQINPPLFKGRLPPHTHTSSNSHHCILDDASTSFIVYKQQLRTGKFDCMTYAGSTTGRVDSLSPASSPLNYICMYVCAYADPRLPTPIDGANPSG